MKICVSIAADSSRAALTQMRKAAAVADMVELRIDRIGGKNLDQLLRSKSVPVVVTNRLKAEGGSFSGTESERLADLRRAVALGADIVDIELKAGKRAIAALSSQIEKSGGQTKLLISCHDFTKTPPDRLLKKKVEACVRAGADIVKIVTFANRMEDNLRILNLIPRAKDMGVDMVAFCMGPLGRISRIAAPLFGAPFTFASLERGAESAPGQMTGSELKKIFSIVTQHEEKKG